MAKYPKTLGRIEAVWNKLGGEEGVDRFLRGELTVSESAPRVWKTWKTIYLGTKFARNADGFRGVLKAGGYEIGNWANNILGKPAFTVANQEVQVELVKATVKELTGKDQATYQEICQCAGERGLKLCPAEVGPQLRLQYPDQPYGEWLVIAMEPITDSDGDLEVFGVEHDDDGRWLSSYYGNPERVWRGDGRFVFCK